MDAALMIHAACRALKSQSQAEQPSMACTTARCTRKLIVLLDRSVQPSTSQVPGAKHCSLLFLTMRMLSDGVSLGSLTCGY